MNLKIPYERVLFALGIRYVGQTVSKNLAKKFKSIDDLISKSYEELIEVDEIGERIAESVVNFFNDDKNLKIIERLKSVGLQFNLQKLDTVSNIFEGKTFVVSGVFNSYSRNELKSLIESYGGKNLSTVSSKTNFLLAGDKMGPSKLKKLKILAQKLFLKQILIR